LVPDACKDMKHTKWSQSYKAEDMVPQSPILSDK